MIYSGRDVEGWLPTGPAPTSPGRRRRCRPKARTEPVKVPSADGAVSVFIAQVTDDGGPYPVTENVDEDELTVEQAARLAAVLTEHARRLREITQA